MMTGNPLSGHTAANQASMAGSGVFTDSLEDGEHITSPTLTNMLEGVHGNGIILEEDTASSASNRNTPEDLPGVCEQDTIGSKIRITGGSVLIDGVVYEFAGGPGSSILVEFKSTSPHVRSTPTAPYLSTGEEALIVVYASTDTTNNCITWEIGTPVTTASNTYPTTPSAFLSDPKSGLGVKQSVVLAVIRVEYDATDTNDMKMNIIESNDKRVFVRPNPIYFTPVTTGIVGNKTAVDSHTALDSLHSETGDLAGSRLGALWQSYNADGDANLYYSVNDSANTRHTHLLGPTHVDVSSPSSNQTFTFGSNQIFVLTPSTTINLNPSGTFPPGYTVFVSVPSGSTVTFDSTGLNSNVVATEATMFTYDGSAWKKIMVSGTVSPASSGASGLVQLSDGAGGFTSDANLSWQASPAELTITGKLNVTGLIDPTGLELDPQVANPGGVAANTLWLDSGASNRPKIGSNAVMRASDNISELTNDAGFTDAAAASAAAPVQSVNSATGAVVLDADDISDTATTNKFTTSADISKLAGIEAGATADQTAGEIKIAYESNADTNAFTDAEKTKLTGIATGATAYSNADAIAAVEGEGTLDLTGAVTVVGDLAVDTDTLFVDVSADRVGVNTNSPSTDLHVYGASNPEVRIQEVGQSGYTSIIGYADNYGAVRVFDSTANESTILDLDAESTGTGNQTIRLFRTANSSATNTQFQILIPGTPTTAYRLYADAGSIKMVHYGEAIFNENGDAVDFRVEGDTDANLIFGQGSTDKVGIGTNTPAQKLEVNGTIRQTAVTNNVLVANANGDLVAASNLADQAYSTTDTTDAAVDVYAANPLHWAGIPPATVAEALDRIAAWANNPAYTPGPIP